jgi:hypothetical protein
MEIFIKKISHYIGKLLKIALLLGPYLINIQIINVIIYTYIEKPLKTNKSTYKTFEKYSVYYKKSNLFKRFNLIKVSNHTPNQNGQIKKSQSK